jgi:hypothetical protein
MIVNTEKKHETCYLAAYDDSPTPSPQEQSTRWQITITRTAKQANTDPSLGIEYALSFAVLKARPPPPTSQPNLPSQQQQTLHYQRQPHQPFQPHQ